MLGAFSESTNQCLTRDPDWLQYYQHCLKILPRPVERETATEALLIAKAESNSDSLWRRDYPKAIKSLEAVLAKSTEFSRIRRLASSWIGYCLQLLGDDKAAQDQYYKAHQLAPNIPPYALKALASLEIKLPPQLV